MLVNLTPHDITIYGEHKMTIPASGNVCRVACTVQDTGMCIDGVQITRNTYGEIEGLPEEIPGTVYIVSSIVRNALIENGVHRNDIVVPNESIRDYDGRIIGCKSLAI